MNAQIQTLYIKFIDKITARNTKIKNQTNKPKWKTHEYKARALRITYMALLYLVLSLWSSLSLIALSISIDLDTQNLTNQDSTPN